MLVFAISHFLLSQRDKLYSKFCKAQFYDENNLLYIARNQLRDIYVVLELFERIENVFFNITRVSLYSVRSLKAWHLFHKTFKTSLDRIAGLCKYVFMFYETKPWMLSKCICVNRFRNPVTELTEISRQSFSGLAN